MARTKRKPGDFILSWWEDNYGREEYVYGHVSSGVAYATLKRELGVSCDSAALQVRHAYLRIGKASEELRSSGCDTEFYEVKNPGPGAMPVTIAKYSDLFPSLVSPGPSGDQV